MDFDNKELCQNLGELVMMKVAGELDADQYEACTEYMLKEAGVLEGFGKIWKGLTKSKAVPNAPLTARNVDKDSIVSAISSGNVSTAPITRGQQIQQGVGEILDATAGVINKGIDTASTVAAKTKQITGDTVASGENIQKLVNQFGALGQALGFTAKETAPALTTGKALGLIGAGGVGSLGLANLLSAAGNAKSYDPYEY